MFRSTALLFLLWCACTKAVEYEDCGSEYDALSITIDGCSSAPCNIVIGSSTNVISTFIAGSESNALYQNVYLRLNGINLAVNATPAPCAAGSDTVCPVRAGNFNRYSAVVNFAADLPPVAGSLYWTLTDNVGITVICYKVSVRIVYGSNLLEAPQP